MTSQIVTGTGKVFPLSTILVEKELPQAPRTEGIAEMARVCIMQQQ